MQVTGRGLWLLLLAPIACTSTERPVEAFGQVVVEATPEPAIPGDEEVEEERWRPDFGKVPGVPGGIIDEFGGARPRSRLGPRRGRFSLDTGTASGSSVRWVLEVLLEDGSPVEPVRIIPDPGERRVVIEAGDRRYVWLLWLERDLLQTLKVDPQRCAFFRDRPGETLCRIPGRFTSSCVVEECSVAGGMPDQRTPDVLAITTPTLVCLWPKVVAEVRPTVNHERTATCLAGLMHEVAERPAD